jgi:hypothetical protein
VRVAPAVLLLGGCLFAVQNPRESAGRLEGTVQDENEARVVGAEVTLLRAGTTDAVAKVRTDPQGSFVLRDMPKGLYDLQLHSVGFVRTTIRALALSGGESKRLPPLTIEVGSTGCLDWNPLWQQFLEVGGQSGSDLSSTVVDRDEKPLKDVTIRLTGPAQNARELRSSDGIFRFKALQPGSYRIRVHREGYFDWEQPWVRVRTGFLYQYPPVRLVKCLDPRCDPSLRPPAQQVCE